ncbi:hypothetical protein HHK36_030706 [Tetracentron sinense]|uniref:Uncharacterized protein n=1 Tax=Tetracentron sinense TaxID=13715 RepID=A0A834YA19_TETSI|nr:hypothetical protein HHK36_030706 [Tetracentron sinense]
MQQYLLSEKEEKPDQGGTPVDESPTNTAPKEIVDEKTEEPSVAAEESSETPQQEEPGDQEVVEQTAKVISETPEQEESGDQEVVEQKPEIKLETAPADFRFPTTNQSRHCFTRYIEYHRCIAAKGEDAPECDKFAKYYRSLCPGEWVRSLHAFLCPLTLMLLFVSFSFNFAALRSIFHGLSDVAL